MKTLSSNFAQEVDACLHALLALRRKLDAPIEPESPIEISHTLTIIRKSGKGFLSRSDYLSR